MKLSHISKTYYNKGSTVQALKDINLEFSQAGLTVILGPSGCGKTSLLNIISGVDHQFEGQRIDVPQMGYLTQDVQLFESMTVYENLVVVKNDKVQIEDYLKKYNMWDHRNKKVKKCSSGQKKRVQFLCSLLQSPMVLLCDEPTAALDYENKEVLMQDLKEVSKNIQVIVVTHDVAVAQKYADRIITMGKGYVESDELFHQMNGYEVQITQNKKTFMDTLRLLWYEWKSRKVENLLFVLMLVIGITSIFSTVSLFTTVEFQTNELELYKKGANFVYSYPINDKRQLYKESGIEEDLYVECDYILYNEVLEMIEMYPEIIAVEAFYDSEVYYNSLTVKQRSAVLASNIENAFKKINWPIYREKFKEAFQTDYIPENGPEYPAILMTKDIVREFDSYEEEGKANHFNMDDFPDYYSYIGDYGVSFFDLLDKDAITIIYGEMADETNEVVICKDVADLLLKKNEFGSYEEMIGSTITLGIYSRTSYSLEYEYELLDYYFDDESIHALESFEFVISGISNTESDYLNAIYFDSEFAKNPIMQYFVNDYNSLYFEYVRFILNPSVDTEKFLEKINREFEYERNNFYTYNTGIALKEVYRSRKNMLIFGCSTVVIFLLVLSFIMYLQASEEEKNKE